MGTSSAHPDRLEGFGAAISGAAQRTTDLIAPVARARADLDAHGIGTGMAPVEAHARSSVEATALLARAVAAVGRAFTAADRSTRSGPATAPPTTLADAIAAADPHLAHGSLHAPVAEAEAAGRAVARALLAASAARGEPDTDDLVDRARRLLHDLVAGRHVDPGRFDHAAATVMTVLGATGTTDAAQVVASTIRRSGARPPFLDLATVFWSAPQVEALVRSMARRRSGRNALRALADHAPALPMAVVVALGEHLVVRHDAGVDAAQDPALAPELDPLSRWLNARHQDADGPVLALLGAHPGATERVVAGQRRRVRRLFEVAEGDEAQRALGRALVDLATGRSTYDADGTTSAHGRTIVRQVVEGSARSQHRAGSDLARSLAVVATAHPDAVEALARGRAADLRSLDGFFRDITARPTAHAIAVAGLMHRRRQLMAGSLHAPLEHRIDVLVESAQVQRVLEGASRATDAEAVDVAAYEGLRRLLPFLKPTAKYLSGADPVAMAGASAVAFGLDRLLLHLEADHQREGRRHAAAPRNEAARRQVRIDAWRTIAADPRLAPLLEHGTRAPLDHLPLTGDSFDRLTEWEQRQPAALRDIVTTYCGGFEEALRAHPNGGGGS